MLDCASLSYTHDGDGTITEVAIVSPRQSVARI